MVVLLGMPYMTVLVKKIKTRSKKKNDMKSNEIIEVKYQKMTKHNNIQIFKVHIVNTNNIT